MPNTQELLQSMTDYTEEEQKRVIKAIQQQYGLTYQEVRKLTAEFAEKTTKSGKIDNLEANKYNRVETLTAGVITLLLLNKKTVDKMINPFIKQTYADNYNYTAYTLEGFKKIKFPALDDINTRFETPLDVLAKEKSRDNLLNGIKRDIQSGVVQGKTPAELNKSLKARMTVNQNNELNIMENQMDRVSAEGRNKAMGVADNKGLDIFKIWNARLDRKTRVSHAELDGDMIPFDEPFKNGLMFPKDPTGEPAEVINCRCDLEYTTSEGGELSDQYTNFKKWKE